MKATSVILGIIALAFVAVVAWYMIDIEQTREARLPDVDVNVTGGQTPDYDVRTGDVDIGTKQTTVQVPDVKITTEEREITVPSIEITPPEENAAQAGEPKPDATSTQ